MVETVASPVASGLGDVTPTEGPPQREIDTFPNRFWFGLGAAGEGIAGTGMSLLLFYYSQVLGLDARLAGLALLISIVTDGVSDLLV
jgi:hypothetical protein